MKEPAKKDYYRVFLIKKNEKQGFIPKLVFNFIFSPLQSKWIYIQVDNLSIWVFIMVFN
jgi:hypothetical protein